MNVGLTNMKRVIILDKISYWYKTGGQILISPSTFLSEAMSQYMFQNNKGKVVDQKLIIDFANNKGLHNFALRETLFEVKFQRRHMNANIRYS